MALPIRRKLQQWRRWQRRQLVESSWLQLADIMRLSTTCQQMLGIVAVDLKVKVPLCQRIAVLMIVATYVRVSFFGRRALPSPVPCSRPYLHRLCIADTQEQKAPFYNTCALTLLSLSLSFCQADNAVFQSNANNALCSVSVSS